MRRARRALLVPAGADLLRDLSLHQFTHEPGEARAQRVGVLIARDSARRDEPFHGPYLREQVQ